jgi:hypothetical protein
MRDIGGVIVGVPVLFAVVCPENATAITPNPVLLAKIQAAFPDGHFQVSTYHWLIVAGGTTAREVAEKLGINDRSAGSGIVYSVSNYWGRANPQVWEWIRAKMGGLPNA